MQTSPLCLSCEHNPGPSSLATRCLLAARNKNGSPTKSGSRSNSSCLLVLQCVHFGKRVTRTIKSDSVKSH
jgi:hypothetical protein